MGGKHAGRGNDQLSSRRQQQGATESLRLIERFTPVSPNKVEWSVTYDDASVDAALDVGDAADEGREPSDLRVRLS